MQTHHSENNLLHVKEAAVELGQHEVSVRRHIREGRLRAVRLGPNGRVRIRRADLDEFLRPYSENEK